MKLSLLLSLIPGLVAAQEAAAAPAAGGRSMLTLLGPMVVLFAIWYFLLILPQQKKEKKRQAMLKALKRGDRVITIGGIHGVVEKADEQIVQLKIGGVLVDFSRSAIASVGGLQDQQEKKS